MRDWRKENRERMKALWDDPVWRAERIAALKAAFSVPLAERKACREAKRAAWLAQQEAWKEARQQRVPVRGCYLIHFSTPYRHARHYLGWSEDIENRIKAHRIGCGARLMQVITQMGIAWQVVRIWEGVGREKERSLKRNQNDWELCPVCKEERKRHGTRSAE